MWNRLPRTPAVGGGDAYGEAMDHGELPGAAPPGHERPRVLHLVHEPGPDPGGLERHLAALCRALEGRVDAATLHHGPHGAVLHVGPPDGPGPRYALPRSAPPDQLVEDPESAAALALALRLVDVDAVHVHQLAGHSPAALGALRGFPGPVVCSVHDHQLLCPNFSLLRDGERHCDLPDDPAVCARCLQRTRVGGELADLARYRAAVADHLDVVDRWVFFSEASRRLVERIHPLDPDRVVLLPHATLVDPDPVPEPPAVDPAVPLRVALVGRGNHKKGLTAVNRLADDLTGTSVEVHHLGPLRAPASPALVLHGPYDHPDLPGLLREANISVVLAPGPFAETFGLVLSEAFASGLPVIAADLGAQAERLRATGAGWLVDPDRPEALTELVVHLDRHRHEIAEAAAAARAVPHHGMAEDAERYAALYAGATGRRAPSPPAAPGGVPVELVRHLAAAAAVVTDRLAAAEAAEDTRRGDRWLATLRRPAAVRLVRRPDGRLAVVEHGTRRVVRSPLVAAAVLARWGPPEDLDDAAWDALEPGIPVTPVRPPGGPPCIVVGGHRHELVGLPPTQAVDRDRLEQLPRGEDLVVRRRDQS